MAAFTSEDPDDRAAFDAHWTRILAIPTVTMRTVLLDGVVAGHVGSFGRLLEDRVEREVTYWIDRACWGRGVATAALGAFLELEAARPLFARVARDNLASFHVLRKQGFVVTREERGFANARGEEIEELVLRLS